MPADLQPTEPLPFAEGDIGEQEKTYSLLVVRDGETSTYPLPASGKVLVGRAREADIRVDHGSVSREHAALHLGSTLRIEDLGSANGTRVRDEPLKRGVPVEVFPDDVIDLGTVLLVVQYRKLVQRLRRSCDRAFFEVRVEEECARARDGHTMFAVARLEVEGGLGSHAVHLLLASALERGDIVANGAPGQYELLIADAAPEEAERRVELARKLLAQRDLRVRASVTCCPRDGRTADRILGRKVAEHVASSRFTPAGVVVRDEAMVRVCRLLERIADSALPVILLGETGVGKEICAELVHRSSPRASMPLLRLNCAALPENLLESELFGHTRGAFTGAHADKPGLLESATGGTVFLDEVGDMALATQVKLLRVLEAKEVLRLGARKPEPIDIRLIAATNQDLQERITDGRFREDLFYRLNGISVIVPPLRERPSDIEPLARHFITLHTPKGKTPPALSAASVAWLESHPWPGNVRELRNLIARAVILCNGPVLEPHHMPVGPHPPNGQSSRRPSNGTSVPARNEAQGGLRDEVKALEKGRIEGALDACEGNQRRAADKLGISRGALLRRMDQLGISRSRKGS